MINRLVPRYKEIHTYYLQLGKSVSNRDMVKADKENAFNKTAWSKAGKEKMQGLLVDKKSGGLNFSALETCAAMEGFAKGSNDNGLNFSIGAHLLASVFPISKYGSKSQQKEFLPSLTCGNKIAANAITEKKSGSDVFSMEGFAEKKGKDYIVNAEKLFVTNAPIANVFVVYVMTDRAKGFFGGVSAFIIPSKTKGIEVSLPKDKMGLRTCHMGFISFKGVKISESLRIGKEGAGAQIFNESMIWERTVLSAMTLGQLERVFETTVNFCKHRTINGKKLIQLPNVAHQLAEIKSTIHAAKNLVYDAAFSIDENKRDSLLKSSMAKLFVTENGVEAVRKMQLLYGGAGYLTETEIEREYRDMVSSLTYSGTSAIQKNIISGTL